VGLQGTRILLPIQPSIVEVGVGAAALSALPLPVAQRGVVSMEEGEAEVASSRTLRGLLSSLKANLAGQGHAW
jgi:hypothetical protein